MHRQTPNISRALVGNNVVSTIVTNRNDMLAYSTHSIAY